MVLSPRSPLRAESYEALKARVHNLKREAQRVAKSSQAVSEVESVALLQQKQHYETALGALREEVVTLGGQLRTNTERSAKLRQHYEKDKKVLQAQVAKLEKALGSCNADHACTLTALSTEHKNVLAELRAEIEELKNGREDDRRAFERARDEAVTDVDEWCQGEVAALNAAHAKALASVSGEAARWRAVAGDAEAQYLELSELLAAARTYSDAADVRCDAFAGELEAERQEREQERRGWHERVESDARVHADAVVRLKAAHVEQLGMVEERVRGVVRGKDDAIARLQTEVAAVTQRLQRFEGLLAAGSPARRPGLDMRSMTRVR